MVINKVNTSDGRVLLDLTSDTVTTDDVLEGRTFHLASGVSAAGTYKPSKEIEARLRATVGHSAINLFEPKYRQGTSSNTSTASAVCSLTVVPTEYGKTHIFRKFNSDFSFRVYGTNDEGKAAILSGGALTQSTRLYEGDYVYDESWTHTNETQGVTCYVIMVRKPNFPLTETVTYQNITPSDVPSNLIMVNESITADRRNLLEITLDSGTFTTGGANLTYTVDKTAGTITLNGTTRTDNQPGVIVVAAIENLAGNYYVSGGDSANCYVRAHDAVANAYCKKWDGTTNSSGSTSEDDLEEMKFIAGHTTNIRIRFTPGQTLNNVVVKPRLYDGEQINGTFEPYITPTDEKKQDKPVVLWEAALNSTGVSEVAISSLADDLSNYSYLKVIVTNELGATITDQEAIQTDIEYNPSYIGQDVAKSTGGMLGFHTENGGLVFDRLFIWVLSDGLNIMVLGLRDHNDSSGPPDVVSGVFIRKIIGIPK